MRQFDTSKNPVVSPGMPVSPGAVPDSDGVQFSLFSRNAGSVTLVLFESSEPDSPFREIPLDPNLNKTGDIWHIRVEGIGEGQLYGYRIDGPYSPREGHRFNRHKMILDPHTRAVTGNFEWKLADARGYDPSSDDTVESFSTVDSVRGAPRCVVTELPLNERTPSLGIHFSDTIIYETHLRGFTCHPSSGIEHAGTFRGLVEKIPYLRELGVTAVELMPIMEFDEDENLNHNPLTGEKLKNYWGYSTISFLAPRGRYASSGTTGGQVREFREMVEALHHAGIEVILDVVINHTAEGDHHGPTLCFRGIDNSIYYILENDRRFYKNYSGCGNTFNCNHPIVRTFILDCLKYWVMEMKVDGFRFDLASILGRDQEGNMLSNPPLLERIAEEPLLRNTKIIAEAWDAGGAYQVGNFPGRWADWNGKYRDEVRMFWRGDENMAGRFATRITGSSDLYDGKGPLHGINFITCHDGFTLNDLVSFRCKHNIANGEDNCDGENSNMSDNFGIEGAPATPYIDSLRKRRIKNFIATLFLSQGVPMMLSGDEFCRTQGGNNNPWCQDNETSWVDWEFMESHGEMFRFTREMIRFRKSHPVLRRSSFFTGEPPHGSKHSDISWHGVHAMEPDWSPESRLVACLLNGMSSENGPDADIFMVFNASLVNHVLDIPPAPSGGDWKMKIDTSRPSPEDLIEDGAEIPVIGSRYPLRRMSVLVLVAEPR